MGNVTRCGICSSGKLTPVLDLGEQPLAERDTGERYPLKLLRCCDCLLVQLSYIVDQETVFPPDHPYTSGNTAALKRHARDLVMSIERNLKINDMIVDIGANDGTLLSAFAYPNKLKLVAIEPTDQINKRHSKQIIAYQEFFTAQLAMKIAAKHGWARTITACNVLAHVPDPRDFMAGISILLDDDGEFITENHDWASVEDGLQIDTIYHEHLRYYSVASLTHLLEMYDFRVTSVEPIAIHGGSFRVRARKKIATPFTDRVMLEQSAIQDIVYAASNHGPVYGIGATTRATPLIHFTNIAGYLDRVCEVAGSDKIGTTIPGTNISVVDEACLVTDQPPFALLLSWHLADDIIPKIRELGYYGKFIIPLPEAKVIDG